MLWQLRWNLVFTAWTPEYTVFEQPRNFRIRVKLVDYPQPIWQPINIEKVLGVVGEIESIDDVYLQSDDRTAIYAWVHCADPKRIPGIIDIHYEQYWSECKVHILSWGYSGGGRPPPGVPPVGTEEEEETHGDASPARSSLIRAHVNIRDYYRELSPEPSASSDSSATDAIDHCGPKEEGAYLSGSPAPRPTEQKGSITNGPIRSSRPANSDPWVSGEKGVS